MRVAPDSIKEKPVALYPLLNPVIVYDNSQPYKKTIGL